MEGLVTLLILLFVATRVLSRFSGKPHGKGRQRRLDEPPPWLRGLLEEPSPKKRVRAVKLVRSPGKRGEVQGEGLTGGGGPKGSPASMTKELTVEEATCSRPPWAGIEDDWARGMVMAEVLGPPRALRPYRPR